jgi:hypothetical protein
MSLGCFVSRANAEQIFCLKSRSWSEEHPVVTKFMTFLNETQTNKQTKHIVNPFTVKGVHIIIVSHTKKNEN